jgi:hypothetical protein
VRESVVAICKFNELDCKIVVRGGWWNALIWEALNT